MLSGLRSLLFVPGDDERKLSRAGKACVHPGQVATVNEIFSPTKAEVSWAQDVLAVFGAAEAAGSGVTVFEGRLVDAPPVSRARRILACPSG